MDSSPIPKPKTTDHEDVSWALSTAEANWKRGDQGDALKWLQRAAEAASEAGLDTRYLELAKAASELAARIESSPGLAPLPPLTPIPQTDNVPLSGPGGRPSGPTIIQPMGIVLPDARPDGRRKSTPPPVPSRTPAPAAGAGAAGGSSSPLRSSSPPRMSTGPVRTASKPSPPRVAPPTPSHPAAMFRGGEKKDAPQPQVPAPLDSRPEIATPIQTGERRVEHLQTVRNLDKMAHLAALTRPSDSSGSPRLVPRPPDPEDQTQIMPASVGPETEVQPVGYGGPPSRSEGAPHRADVWPTQGSVPVEDATYVGAVPILDSMSDATLVPDPAAPRPTQALRVVVYRTPDGVRIAPAGQKISAMSIEAMLVALDPSADLAAWLK